MTPEERAELDRLLVERHKAHQAFQEASVAYIKAEVRISKAMEQRRLEAGRQRRGQE